MDTEPNIRNKISRGKIHGGVLRPMSDGNRGILAALAAIAALPVAAGVGAFYGSLYSPPKKQYAAVDAGAASSEAYQGVTKSLPDIALIPEPIERAIANPAPYSGNDHEKRDLAAQESMAAWSFYMTVFAGFTALVTFIGTILIWRQVSYTRQAVQDTTMATRAMNTANGIAARQLEAAYRPKLILEPFGQAFMERDMTVRDGPARQLPIFVGIKARNVGVGACQIDEICFQWLGDVGPTRQRIEILLKSDSEAVVTEPHNLVAFNAMGVDENGRGAHIIQHIIGTTVVEGHILMHRIPNVIGSVRYTDMLDIQRERGFELSQSGRGFRLVEGSAHDYDKVITQT